jgi:hypothetical protein
VKETRTFLFVCLLKEKNLSLKKISNVFSLKKKFKKKKFFFEKKKMDLWLEKNKEMVEMLFSMSESTLKEVKEFIEFKSRRIECPKKFSFECPYCKFVYYFNEKTSRHFEYTCVKCFKVYKMSDCIQMSDCVQMSDCIQISDEKNPDC